jgi:transposase
MGQSCLLKGLRGLKAKHSLGKSPKLIKTQRKKLAKIITEGPTKAGFPGVCWRSPMIQLLIYEKFGVQYSVHYIPQLFKNMGFSYQKAKFVANHKDSEKRHQWLQETWPKILALDEEKKSLYPVWR